jgi:hypothetical protein
LARQGVEDGDTLEGGLYALVAVMKFLDQDPSAAGASIPLAKIANAILDVITGNQPVLFQSRAKSPGRPSGTALHHARAAIALSVKTLMKSGVSRQDTGRFVAEELSRAGVREKSNERIKASQVLRWHDEIGGRAPAATNEFYRTLLEVGSSQAVAKNPEEAKQRVKKIIQGVKLAAF